MPWETSTAHTDMLMSPVGPAGSGGGGAVARTLEMQGPC